MSRSPRVFSRGDCTKCPDRKTRTNWDRWFWCLVHLSTTLVRVTSRLFGGGSGGSLLKIQLRFDSPDDPKSSK